MVPQEVGDGSEAGDAHGPPEGADEAADQGPTRGGEQLHSCRHRRQPDTLRVRTAPNTSCVSCVCAQRQTQALRQLCVRTEPNTSTPSAVCAHSAKHKHSVSCVCAQSQTQALRQLCVRTAPNISTPSAVHNVPERRARNAFCSVL